MYQDFGAVVTDQRVTFKLFLPDNTVDPDQYARGGSPRIKEIRIRGTFQRHLGGENWDFDSAPIMTKQAHPKGWLYTYEVAEDLPEDFYEYKYFVTFENETIRWCTDPCTKYGCGGQDENSGFVIGSDTLAVQPLSFRLPPQDLIIYEMMIDDFTAEYRRNTAPIDAVRERLDYLESLGVNAVEFMPWTAWPGSGFSWGYDPFQFFSVEFRYLNDPEDPCNKLYKLKLLFNEMHERGMHVIMDGVFNHVRGGIDPNKGFPYLWLYENPADSPYIGAFSGGGFFEDFDYNNTCTQEFIRDICLYWIDEYKIDGIRFDYTRGFYEGRRLGPGIARLISDLNTYLASTQNENVALILEHLTDNRYEAINDTNQIDATASWFDPFMYESFQYARSGHLNEQVLRILNANLDFAPGKGPVTYIENHDHSYIVSEAGGRDRWYKTQPAAIALFTSPGLALIRNGQEFGEDYYLPNSGSGRVVPRPLRWNQMGPDSGDFIGSRLFEIYQKLIRIRKEYPALRSTNFFPFENHPDGYGADLDKDVVIFHRYAEREDGSLERLIVVINYSDFDQEVTVPFSTNGIWTDVLNDGFAQVSDFRLYNQVIPSNWGRIYVQ